MPCLRRLMVMNMSEINRIKMGVLQRAQHIQNELFKMSDEDAAEIINDFIGLCLMQWMNNNPGKVPCDVMISASLTHVIGTYEAISKFNMPTSLTIN